MARISGGVLVIRVWVLALFAAVALVGNLAQGAPSASSVVVEFSYAGASQYEGHVQAQCQAVGAILPSSGSVVVAGGSHELFVEWARVNRTVIGVGSEPMTYEAPDRLWFDRFALNGESTVVEWGQNGLATLWDDVGSHISQAGLNASIDTPLLRATSSRLAIASPAESFWSQDSSGQPQTVVAQFPGWNRLVEADGEITVSGSGGLHLRHATVVDDGVSRTLSPHRTVEERVGTEDVYRERVRYEEGWLTFEDATLVLPPESQLVCGTMSGTVNGSLSANQASGKARSESQSLQFEDRVLTLTGAFGLHETPRNEGSRNAVGWVDADARGSISNLGLDFSAVSSDDDWVTTTAAMGVATALAILLLLLVKNAGVLLGAFYSRVGLDRALENSNRGRIYEAVLQEPGVDLSRLSEYTQSHLTTVTYHVHVLKRVGLVRTVRHGRSIRVVPDGDRRKVRDVVVARDEHLAFVQGLASGDRVALRDVVGRVRTRFGVSRQGAYQIVDRAVVQGVVQKSMSEGKVMVACNA